jgi:hypothetical protein
MYERARARWIRSGEAARFFPSATVALTFSSVPVGTFVASFLGSRDSSGRAEPTHPTRAKALALSSDYVRYEERA